MAENGIVEALGRAKRGPYRSTYTVILTEPAFITGLTADEKLTWWTLKHWPEGNLAHIFTVYMEPLIARTSLEGERLATALVGLETKGWARADAECQLIWLVNGLKWAPEITLSNEKHRTGILKVLVSLPRSPLVEQFCEYYELPFPNGYPSHRVSDTHPIRIGMAMAYPSDTQVPNTGPERQDHIMSHLQKPDTPADGYTDEFNIFWASYPNRPGQSKKKAFRAWKARKREGITAPDLTRAAGHYAQARDGQDPEYTLHASSFIGRDEHWKQYLDGVPEGGAEYEPADLS